MNVELETLLVDVVLSRNDNVLLRGWLLSLRLFDHGLHRLFLLFNLLNLIEQVNLLLVQINKVVIQDLLLSFNLCFELFD
jgi:hypothetical protein